LHVKKDTKPGKVGKLKTQRERRERERLPASQKRGSIILRKKVSKKEGRGMNKKLRRHTPQRRGLTVTIVC